MRPHIKVTLELGQGRSIEVNRELSEDIFHNSIHPLDLPSPDAGISKILCTDTITIRRVMRNRKDIAKFLSSDLTRELLNLMGARDTVMGYPTNGTKGD